MQTLWSDTVLWKALPECGILKTVRTGRTQQIAVGRLLIPHSSNYSLVQNSNSAGCAPGKMGLLWARLSHSPCWWVGQERHKLQFWPMRHEISTTSFKNTSSFLKWDMKSNEPSFLHWPLDNVVWGWDNFELHQPSCNYERANLRTNSNMLKIAEKKMWKKIWPLIILLSLWINFPWACSSSKLLIRDDNFSLLLSHLTWVFHCSHLNTFFYKVFQILFSYETNYWIMCPILVKGYRVSII